MGVLRATHHLVLASLVAAAGCSVPTAQPGSQDPPVGRVTAIAESATVPEPEPFGWPATGWLRLDVDVTTVLGGGSSLRVGTSMAAAWAPGRLEVWIQAPDPDTPGDRVTIDRVVSNGAADAAIEGLQGRFAVSLADGLGEAGDGADGGRRFSRVEHDHDITVDERWEIGDGDAPWGADGPFGAGS